MNHKPDVMKLLADARPASLDRMPDAARRTRDIGRAIAVGSEVDSAGYPRASLGASLRPDDRSPRRPAARPVSRTMLGLGLAVTAGAAAAAVFVATAGNGAQSSAIRHGVTSSGHVASPGAGQPALSAHAVLLRAATNAAKAPSAGRYWRTITTNATIDPVGPPGDSYGIEIRTRLEQWDAVAPSGQTWTISQILGAHPASAADKAAWRRDGSPTSWPSDMMVTINGVDAIGMGPVLAQASWRRANGTVGSLGKDRMTLRQLLALPADPAQLDSVLRQHVVYIPAVAPKVTPSVDVSLFLMGTELLTAPVTSQVRAAVFQMLARLSGVRALGAVRDPLGRPGYGFAVPLSPGVSEEELVVIDPGTGSVLARETVATGSWSAGTPAIGGKPSSGAGYTFKAGQVVSYRAVLDAGWTNETPSPPAARHAPAAGAR